MKEWPDDVADLVAWTRRLRADHDEHEGPVEVHRASDLGRWIVTWPWAGAERARLIAPDAALPHLPRTDLGADSTRRLQQGQAVIPQCDGEPGLARAYGPAGLFLGLVEIEPGPLVKPVRLFNNLGADST